MSHQPLHHRYCSHCAWGFSFNAWASSRFCPRCGNRVSSAKGSNGTANFVKGKAVRMESPAPSANGRLPRITLDRTKISGMWKNLSDWVRRHPCLSAVIFVAGGAGMIIAGPAVTALGAAVAALGVTIIKGSTICGLVLTVLSACAARAGDSSDASKVGVAGLVVAGAGAAIGMVVIAFGAILAAVGAILTGAGYVILAAGLLILVLRAGQAIHSHRHEIAELARAMRNRFRGLPADGNTGILPEGSKWDVETLLAQVDAELVRTKGVQN